MSIWTWEDAVYWFVYVWALPRKGSLTVRFMLHRWAWQHSTIWSGDGGVLQVILPCSYTLKQPFWDTGIPSLRVKEEKHCWPIQRSPVTHDRPSQTHSCSVGAAFNSPSGKKKINIYRILDQQMWYLEAFHNAFYDLTLIQCEIAFRNIVLCCNLFPRETWNYILKKYRATRILSISD